FPLSLSYRGEPMKPSWIAHEIADRVEDCLRPFTWDEVITAMEAMLAGWSAALPDYVEALSRDMDACDALHRQRRREELSCARMIELQLRSMLHVLRFHRRRAELMSQAGLQAPCTLPRDAQLLELMRAEIDNAQAALPLVRDDP